MGEIKMKESLVLRQRCRIPKIPKSDEWKRMTFSKRMSWTKRMTMGLLCQYNMQSKGWQVRLSQQLKNCCGLCNYKRREVVIAVWFIELNTIHRILDTVRHEIAHVMTEHEEDDHGEEWHDWCIRLGCEPSPRIISTRLNRPGIRAQNIKER